MAPVSRLVPPERRYESVILRPGPIGRARTSLRALEALDRVTASGTAPTSGDLDDLRGWAGWGPMAPAFAPLRKGAWQEIGERLEWLLPPDQLREAEQATPNAFYTPPALAAGCWQILLELGFTGGRVLEPGCGAGAFSLPEILAAQHNGQAPRPQRTARPRSPRRITPPPAAPGDADQPVLFDLPAPPAAEPRRASTPQRRSPARRR